MQYEGELYVRVKTKTFSDEAFEIKLAAVQRTLWQQFGPTARLEVEITKSNSEGEILEAYDKIFKPGETLEEM